MIVDVASKLRISESASRILVSPKLPSSQPITVPLPCLALPCSVMPSPSRVWADLSRLWNPTKSSPPFYSTYKASFLSANALFCLNLNIKLSGLAHNLSNPKHSLTRAPTTKQPLDPRILEASSRHHRNGSLNHAPRRHGHQRWWPLHNERSSLPILSFFTSWHLSPRHRCSSHGTPITSA